MGISGTGFYQSVVLWYANIVTVWLVIYNTLTQWYFNLVNKLCSVINVVLANLSVTAPAFELFRLLLFFEHIGFCFLLLYLKNTFIVLFLLNAVD